MIRGTCGDDTGEFQDAATGLADAAPEWLGVSDAARLADRIDPSRARLRRRVLHFGRDAQAVRTLLYRAMARLAWIMNLNDEETTSSGV